MKILVFPGDLCHHIEKNGKEAGAEGERPLKRYKCILFAAALAAALGLLLAGCGAPAETPEPSGGGETPAVEGPAPQSAPTEEEIAAALAADMTTEEKVGQLFFVRCPETGAAEDVAAYHPGGVLLFGRDFEGKTYGQVRAETDGLQAAAEIPLLIGVDEEGGTVVRASSNRHLRAQKFPSPQALYRAGGMEAVAADAAEKSSFLLGLGINVNFAPVCDVSTDSGDFIYDRAFGQDAAATSDYAETVTAAMDAAGIGAVMKHFPGYGNNVDTHTGIAVDQRPYETFETSDFLPFAAGMTSPTAAVLVSHNIVVSMDETLPASLSPEVHRVLREELGFTGVAMTDDLAMDALAQYSADGSAAVLAVQAGNDMIVTTDYESQIPAVIAAVEDGRISEERLDEAVTRVLAWKIRLGLIAPEGEP